MYVAIEHNCHQYSPLFLALTFPRATARFFAATVLFVDLVDFFVVTALLVDLETTFEPTLFFLVAIFELGSRKSSSSFVAEVVSLELFSFSVVCLPVCLLLSLDCLLLLFVCLSEQLLLLADRKGVIDAATVNKRGAQTS